MVIAVPTLKPPLPPLLKGGTTRYLIRMIKRLVQRQLFITPGQGEAEDLPRRVLPYSKRRAVGDYGVEQVLEDRCLDHFK